MDDQPVSEFLLCTVADFIIDELSQNEVTAHDAKARMRRMMRSMVRAKRGSYCDDDMQEAVPATAAANNKRSHAAMEDGAAVAAAAAATAPAAAAAEPAAPASKKAKGKAEQGEKKVRPINTHQAFLTYGTKCIPQKWLDKVHAHVPQGKIMNLIQKYKGNVSEAGIAQFAADVEPIIAELNADPERKAGDSSKLVERLKAADKDAKRKVHPAFKALDEFIVTHGKVMMAEAEARKAAAAANGSAAGGKAKGHGDGAAEADKKGGKGKAKESGAAEKGKAKGSGADKADKGKEKGAAADSKADKAAAAAKKRAAAEEAAAKAEAAKAAMAAAEAEESSGDDSSTGDESDSDDDTSSSDEL